MCAAWYLSLKKRINHPAMFEPNDYLQNVPWDYKANQAFKNWLHDVADFDTKRCIVESLDYDKYIIMQSKVRSMSVSQRFVRLLLTSTSHNNNHRPRSLSQSRRFLLFSQSLSESRLGIRSAYAFSSASRLAFESALA